MKSSNKKKAKDISHSQLMKVPPKRMRSMDKDDMFRESRQYAK
jgi:hypothetical protein